MRKRVIKRLIYIFRWRHDDSKLHKLIDTNDPMDGHPIYNRLVFGSIPNTYCKGDFRDNWGNNPSL